MRYFLNLLLVFVITASCAATPAIQEFQLKNGLKLIVKEDHRAPVVFSSVWYKVGSAYEPKGSTGISHALEHMMFRGTPLYGPGVFDAMINASGGDQNAMTTEDFTFYYQSLPVDKLAQSFELEADRMRHLTLDPTLFAKEIQVVMEERRMRIDDNPQSLMIEKLNDVAFSTDFYRHPVAGWMTDLQKMTSQNLRNWYQQWYVPNNAVVIVIGDVKPAAVLALAKKSFGKLTAKPLPPAMNSKPTAYGAQPRRFTLQAPAQLPWVVLAYNTPSLSTTQSNDPYALSVLAYLLGGGDSSRFTRELVRKQQQAVSAAAEYEIYNLHDNLLLLFATPAKNVTAEILQAALQKEVTNLQNHPIDAKELAQAKASLVADHVFSQDSRSTQAMNLGVPEVTGLSWRKEKGYVAGIESVTAAQIQDVAKRYLTPDRLTIGILEPKGESHDSKIMH